MAKKYDVVIIGGGTSGCACAWNCGRLGLKTLLLEKNIHLGGTITSGFVVPVMKSGDNQINTDFYNELIKYLKQIGGQVEYMGNPGWFNPELAKIALDNMMNDAGVEVLFEVNSISPVTDSNSKYIKSIQISLSECNNAIHTNNISALGNEVLSEYIETKYIVDGTGDANFCKKIGCDFLEDKIFQPMSLRFIMGGVDVKSLGKWLLKVDDDRDVTTVYTIEGVTHLSTAYTWDTNKVWNLAPVFDKAVNDGVLYNEDRNYFQIFTIPGMPDSVAFNCPRIVKNANPDSISERTDILKEARQAIFRLSEFCKKYLKGFENAYISNIADMLGVRVSNRVKGRYIYTINDLRTGKKFDNPALISNYPVDIHNKDKNSSVLESNGEYQLPLESLITEKFDNVYVIGRCISADFESQAALRVQGICFSMGEAVAKDIYSKLNVQS